MGKIISINEAEAEFGKVIENFALPTKDVLSFLNSDGDNLMFLLNENNLYVLNEVRKLVYSTSDYSENNEVFHVYSKSEIAELLELGKDGMTIFENRTSVFSITNGNFTLEYSLPCPPYCS